MAPETPRRNQRPHHGWKGFLPVQNTSSKAEYISIGPYQTGTGWRVMMGD